MKTKIEKININDTIKKALEQINVTTLKNAVSSKKSIYKYPTELTAKNDESLFKKFRKNLRKDKYNFCVNIVTFAKENKITELKKEIESFMQFYKTNFIINDFNIDNFSNTEKNKTLFALALNIVQLNFLKEMKKEIVKEMKK